MQQRPTGNKEQSIMVINKSDLIADLFFFSDFEIT